MGGSDVQITGASGWNNRYIFSKQLFARGPGVKSFSGTVRVDAGGTRRFMWGLKNTNDNYHYNQMPYAIYFNNGSIQIYEVVPEKRTGG